MFKNIQDAGRSLLIICPPAEVMELCDRLQPQRLAFLLDRMLPQTELDRLYLRFTKKYS
jgi:hypothetical protein